MVLGLRSKSRKATAIQVDYTVNVQELKPWPPSQSLRSLRSVVLQWENGDRNSGSGSPVVPSLGDGKIVFNESFKLQVTLLKEGPVKGNDPGTFLRNLLELNFYEPRNKTVKGQHLGSALVDLAEHGIIKEAVSLSIPVNFKRSFRNTAQPVVLLTIRPFEKADGSSSFRRSPSMESSLDKDGRESVSALMNGEYAEEAEIASFTNDDISSSHSWVHSASTLESASSPPHRVPDPEEHLNKEPSKHDANLGFTESSNISESSEHGDGSASDSTVKNSVSVPMPTLDATATHWPSSSKVLQLVEQEASRTKSEKGANYCQVQEAFVRAVHDEFGVSGQSQMAPIVNKDHGTNSTRNEVEYPIDSSLEEENSNAITIAKTEVKYDNNRLLNKEKNVIENGFSIKSVQEHLIAGENKGRLLEYEEEKVDLFHSNLVEVKCADDNCNGMSSVQAPKLDFITEIQQLCISEKSSDEQEANNVPADSHEFLMMKVGKLISDPLKNLNSTGSFQHSMGSSLSVANVDFTEEVKEIDIHQDADDGCRYFNKVAGQSDKENLNTGSDKHMCSDTRFSDNKIEELQHRVAMLEAELREAAAIEVGLYSIVAEHGSSAHKVHTPARRLFRLYSHASKQPSQERRASCARSAVSGLILAAKACGNDIPRLTFWLSNLVVLRAIVSQSIDSSDLKSSAEYHLESDGTPGAGIRKNSSSLRWQSTRKREKNLTFLEEYGDWDDPTTLVSSLKKIEAWIFSRVVESVWWQILMPFMQSSSGSGNLKSNTNLKNSCGRKQCRDDQQQANFSINLWKKAFKDAYEKLCPPRAGGHECGCFPMLPRLIMEQCVARLDVAMFNAILRESPDDIPTDPVSDPIGDPKVLPVPASKTSFGAGAQLKNAIGNWSRWLSDLFGLDDDDVPDEENEQERDGDETASSKSFHLLNALSDLLMLPKDMLLNESVRKEVCPTFSSSIIKMILYSFEPDEFCPDPIPDAVLHSLESEDALEIDEEAIGNFPCDASPIIYSPPSTASITAAIGDITYQNPLKRNSSVLRKGHTSDDELDELDSPLALILTDKSLVQSPRLAGSASALRYQLLHDVWRDEDHCG